MIDCCCPAVDAYDPQKGLKNLVCLRNEGKLLNVDQMGNGGETLLMRAVGGRALPHVRTFLRWGANPEVLGRAGRTALHIAGIRGDPKIMKILLDAGAKIEATEQQQNTALHFAALVGGPSAISVLLKFGADVNRVNASGDTPLNLAAGHGGLDAVVLLIEGGANVNKTPSQKSPPLLNAIKFGRLATIDLLLNSGADIGEIPNFLEDHCFHRMIPNSWKEKVRVRMGVAQERHVLTQVKTAAGMSCPGPRL